MLAAAAVLYVLGAAFFANIFGIFSITDTLLRSLNGALLAATGRDGPLTIGRMFSKLIPSIDPSPTVPAVLTGSFASPSVSVGRFAFPSVIRKASSHAAPLIPSDGPYVSYMPYTQFNDPDSPKLVLCIILGFFIIDFVSSYVEWSEVRLPESWLAKAFNLLRTMTKVMRSGSLVAATAYNAVTSSVSASYTPSESHNRNTIKLFFTRSISASPPPTTPTTHQQMSYTLQEAQALLDGLQKEGCQPVSQRKRKNKSRKYGTQLPTSETPLPLQQGSLWRRLWSRA